MDLQASETHMKQKERAMMLTSTEKVKTSMEQRQEMVTISRATMGAIRAEDAVRASASFTATVCA